MKKITTILTAILVLIFSFSASTYAAEINFTDVRTTDWFYKNLQELTENNIIAGYTDETFKPGNTLKFEEFIKMLVVATGVELKEQKEGQEWYQIYIDKALESKYITDEQKAFIGQNIDRKTMAEILYKVLTEKEDIKAYSDVELEYLSERLTDVNKTDVKILTINGIGVISGYPDGTFKPKGTLTRAEAIAVISRVINTELRNPVKIVAKDANGIIDAKNLELVPVENTGYKDLIDYTEVNRIRDNKVMYEIENVIKADVSMFPIKFGPLVITGIEKLPAEKAPYYGDTSIAWGGFDEADAIVIHAYSVEKTDDYENTIGFSPTSFKMSLVNKSGEIYTKAPARFTTSYGGENVYNKVKKRFPDFALGEYPKVELNQPFTTMIVGESGFELENIDKIIIMDRRWYSSTATRDVLELDAKDVKEIK